MTYLVQVDQNGIPTTEMGMQTFEAVQYQNWFNGNQKEAIWVMQGLDRRTIRYVMGEHMAELYECQTVPVGTIEFAESFLGRKIKPINIPNELINFKYTLRVVGRGTPKEMYLAAMDCGAARLFVKSDVTCKEVPPDIVPREKLMNLKYSKYFYSEDIGDKLISEWRVFVKNGCVQDCRQYLGNWGDAKPDVDTINQMVKAYKNCPPAYTLDVANIDYCGTLRTVVIEVHNFIGCGLYGFGDNTRLLSMLSGAWRWQQKQK